MMNKKRLWFIYLGLLFTVTSAFGFDQTGKYSYTEKGSRGEMIVSEVDRQGGLDALLLPKPLRVSISTSTKILNSYYTCTIDSEENISGRISTGNSISASFISKDQDSDRAIIFEIKFTPKGAIIEVEDDGGYCGMNGTFSGKWVKDVSKKRKHGRS